MACSLPRRGQTSSAGASSDGLLRAGLSGKADVAAPVQSAGTLTPLVPLLGTVGKKDGGHLRGWTTFTVPSYHWGPTVEGLFYFFFKKIKSVSVSTFPSSSSSFFKFFLL